MTNEAIYYRISKQIPDIVRVELLTDNVIYKAVAAARDVHMAILLVVYNNHIHPEGERIDINNPCIACLANILEIFRNLEPYLILLEKESKLLQ